MCLSLKSAFLTGVVVVALNATAAAMDMSDEEIIASAEKAAPAAVAENATVIAMDEQMNMRTVRQGSNGFTCMADNPQSPGTDPMCLDKGGMEWAGAWMSKTEPPKGVVGLGYMLAGGSDASNTDPHATEPPQAGKWVDTGPHIMVFNMGEAIKTYPQQGDNPDTKSPYVMWAGTPYEHLMLPVE
jgi:hypothetical protein